MENLEKKMAATLTEYYESISKKDAILFLAGFYPNSKIRQRIDAWAIAYL